MLCRRLAHLGGGAAEAHRHRQPENGRPRRVGQTATDAVAQAPGDPARLLEDAAARDVALPRRSCRRIKAALMMARLTALKMLADFAFQPSLDKTASWRWPS